MLGESCATLCRAQGAVAALDELQQRAPGPQPGETHADRNDHVSLSRVARSAAAAAAGGGLLETVDVAMGRHEREISAPGAINLTRSRQRDDTSAPGT